MVNGDVYLKRRHRVDINNKFTINFFLSVEHNLPLCHNSKYVLGGFIYFIVTANRKYFFYY